MGSESAGIVGVLPLGRPTFDVAFAREKLAAMLAALRNAGISMVGADDLLFDADATRAAFDELQRQSPDRILVLQVTFTDAGMVAEAASRFAQPLAIWAIPEPRIGGRLRLNSLCGLNLAAHALGLRGREFGWLYASPGDPRIAANIDELLSGGRDTRPVPVGGLPATRKRKSIIAGARLARIGRHPDGFDTCAYDTRALHDLACVTVDPIELPELFSMATAVGEPETSAIRREAEAVAGSLDSLDQEQLGKSLRLKSALNTIRREGNYDAMAIRCWPEAFTEYGGAVCGPVGLMGERKAPCACEADVYGALSSLLLQRVADAPVFLADLVDVDTADDTVVVWHCGQAPASMADPGQERSATIHTNRKMPLLFEFPLKPGRVTFFRISQARGKTFAVIGGGEMLARPKAFTGTSGVVRFDSGAAAALDTIMNAALEHHLALAYGDHVSGLEQAAADLGIPILRL